MTLLLGRRDIAAAVDLGAALDLLAAGFRAAVPEPPALRICTDLPGPGTATCLLPGLLPDVPAYTVKVNAKFPAATPALRGVVCLHALADGELLALLDSASLTAWRTGLAAALATHTLAPPAADTLGFVGAGAQAATTLAGLRHLRRWSRTVATDLDPSRAAALPAEVMTAPPAVAAAADVVVLATWSREPLLDRADVRAGQHLTSLGADEPGKRELSTGLLAASRLIVDDVDLALAGGAVGSAGVSAAGTLGDVLRGDLPAVAPPDVISVYSPVGLPWQDLALSWAVYQAAVHTGAGTRIDLFS